MLASQVAKMQYVQDGNDFMQIVGPGGAIYYAINEKGGYQVKPTLIAVDGAINPKVPGYFVITKGSAAALTLAAPTAGVDDGLEIEISARTAFAHVITATGLLVTATANVNTITFPTSAGGTAYLTADNGKWIVAVGSTVGGAGNFLFA